MVNPSAFSGVGHGGKDPGAVANGLKEADINLVKAKACNEVLTAHGVANPMSRYYDEDDDLNEEIREANASRANIAVDIHTNAGGGDGWEGYHSIGDAEGKRLLECIEKEMIAIGQNSRGAKTRAGAGGKDYYGFIRETTMTAVIVESFFVDSADREIGDTVAKQQAIGVAIAKGILAYFGIPYQGGGSSTPIPTPPPVKPPVLAPIEATYQVHIPGRWLPNVVETSDYAGIFGKHIDGVYAHLSRGSIRYRVHTARHNWLPWVVDRQDFAGIFGHPIDGIEMELIGAAAGTSVKYKAHTGTHGWLPWVTDRNDYAGLFGYPITGIQIDVQ